MKLNYFRLLSFIILDSVTWAENEIVTELLPHDNPLALVKHYQNVRAQIKGSGSGAESSLKALRNEISKKEDLPIDTYNAHWRWHATYYQCETEYRDMLGRLQQSLDQGNPLTRAELRNAIEERACAIWKPMREQELFVITELLQGRSKEGGPEWDFTSLNSIIEEISFSYNASTESIPALYYAAKAELLLALGDEAEAVKVVYAGLEKYRNEANLIDILFRTLVDPKMYDFKQVWERKIPPIALSGVKLLSGCRWVADLAKCNTWDEALAMVDSVFERCRPSEVAKDVKYVVRAFLHTGKFQWKTAQSYIDSVMQFSVFPMVLKLEELRANMITEILKPSTSYRGQGPPNLEVLRRQANQAASRASEPLRTPQTPVVVTSPKVTKPPSQEKRVEAPVTSSASSLGLSTSSSATNLSRPENQENVKPARPSKETQGDRMVGKKAEIEFHKFLWAKDWWRAREAFKVAGYNLYFADVQTLQADWDKVLGWRGRANDLSLDPVIMRFGWRTEFARAQEGHWTKEREAMDQIRNNPLINPSEVLDRLKLGTLIDPRPDQCEKMLDVAKLFARTGKFHRGLQIARAECDDDLEVEDEAGILQAFVEGLYDETRGVDHRAEIANALRYVIEDFEKSTKDWRWGAAALSLRQALLSGGDDDDGLFAPLRPLPVTQLRGGSRFLLLKKKDITVDDINKAIDNDRSPPKDLVNYIPVIKEIFNAQKGNGLNALYLYADAMRNVLTKLKDMGRALQWWELALVTCSARTRFDHHHVERDKLEIDVIQELEALPDEAPTAIFTNLLAKIERQA